MFVPCPEGLAAVLLLLLVLPVVSRRSGLGQLVNTHSEIVPPDYRRAPSLTESVGIRRGFSLIMARRVPFWRRRVDGAEADYLCSYERSNGGEGP